MFSFLHNVLRLSLLLTAAVFICPAETYGQTAKEEPIIRAEFTTYSLRRLKDIKYLPSPEGSSEAIKFFSSARSAVYEYEGTNPIIFFREFPAPTIEDPNAVRREKVAEVTIPQPGEEYLLIFFPDRRTKADDYRIYPLADSTRELPTGAVRFFNATAFNFEGVLGGKRISLTPGPSDYFRVSGSRFSLALAFSHNDKFHQSYNSPLDLGNDSRGLFMIFPPFIKGSTTCQTRFLRQTIKPEETTAPISNVTSN
ncbi:MAG: hypothetical protein ACSHYA_05945 [Opitutaceae bacterium]